MGAGYENIPVWGLSRSFVPTQLDVTETWDGFGKVCILYLPAHGLSVGIFSAHLSALNFWSSSVKDPLNVSLVFNLDLTFLSMPSLPSSQMAYSDEYTCAHISKYYQIFFFIIFTIINRISSSQIDMESLKMLLVVIGEDSNE